VVDRGQRHWPWDRSWAGVAVPNIEPPEIADALEEAIDRDWEKSPSVIQRHLVRAIRLCAQENKGRIGPSVLLLSLTPWAETNLRVDYFPSTDDPSEVAYSPWVAVGGQVWRPMEIRSGSGPISLRSKRFNWTIGSDGEVAERPSFNLRALKRPPDPQRR